MLPNYITHPSTAIMQKNVIASTYSLWRRLLIILYGKLRFSRLRESLHIAVVLCLNPAVYKCVMHLAQNNRKTRRKQANSKVPQTATVANDGQTDGGWSTMSSKDGGVLPSWLASTHCHSRCISNSALSVRCAKMASRQTAVSANRRRWCG